MYVNVCIGRWVFTMLRKTAAKWHEHHPESLVEGEHVTIPGDFYLNIDRSIQENRPDIISINKKENRIK